MRSFSLIVFLSVMFAIISLGCHKDSYTVNKTDLLKKWVLSYVQNTKTHQILSYPDTVESLTFTDSLVSIRGACWNHGHASYSISNDSIRFFDILIFHLDFCSHYQWEDYVENNLDSAYLCNINSDKLTIYSRGSYNLTFAAIASK